MKVKTVHVNDVVTDWSYALAPNFVSTFLVFSPTNPSNISHCIVRVLMHISIVVHAGVGNGDPHYLTFDSTGYHHFQGIGDYTILEVVSIGDNQPIFTLQGRLSRIGSNNRVTWHTGLAFGSLEAAFEVF